MKAFHVSYSISESEFMEAFEAHWKRNKSSTRTNLILGLSALVFGLPMSFALGWLGLVLVIVASIFLLLLWLRSFNHRRAYRATKKFSSEIEIAFTEESIDVKALDGESKLNWTTYTKIVDTPKFLLLYMSPKAFSIIPKSAIKENAEGFLHFLESKIGQRSS